MKAKLNFGVGIGIEGGGGGEKLSREGNIGGRMVLFWRRVERGEESSSVHGVRAA